MGSFSYLENLREYFRGIVFFVTLFTSLLQADLEYPEDAHVSAVAETNSIAQTSLTRIFHTDHLRRPGSQMDVALDSHCDLDSMDSYSPASKCSSALTRLAKLVSPFQGCLKEPANSGQSPPRSLGPPVVPHQASQPPCHDQYEISGLRTSPTPLIIACYNVENYLTMPRWINGRFRTSAGKPENQKQAIATILATLHPDIIGLMEIGDLRQVHDLERHLHHVGLDYPYSEYLQGWDKERHLLLLSRFPLVECHSQAMIPLLVNGKAEHSPRGIIDVTVEPQPNVRLRLIALHFKSKIPVPDYDQAAFRAAEAHYLKSYVQTIMREDPKTYLLVMGDCNDTKNSKPLFTLLGNVKKPGPLQALDLRDDRKESWTQYWKEADEYSRIDYMMVNTRLAPFIIHEHSGIARPASWSEASDHCPLFSEILFQENASLELPPVLPE